MSVIKTLLGPSPLLYGMTKIKTCLSISGGSDECLSDEAFFEMIAPKVEGKPPRMTTEQVRNHQKLISRGRKNFSREQKLIDSVIEHAKRSKIVSAQDFQNAQEMYEFRRKYKNYLRIKRIIPLSLVAPATGTELSKMAYAAALGSKSVCLTLPGLIGYSLPAFYFFHMSGYYAPDKFKPICQVCKYTLGAPFWVVSCLTDEVLSSPEETFFGEPVPIDVVGTGGSIPSDIGDFAKLRDVIDDMKGWGNKSY